MVFILVFIFLVPSVIWPVYIFAVLRRVNRVFFVRKSEIMSLILPYIWAYPCSVYGCIPEDEKRFCFPRIPERAKRWRQLCKNPKFDGIPDEKLHGYKICRRHFARHQFTNELRNKLNRNTDPTLFLPASDTNPCTIVDLNVTVPQADDISAKGSSADTDLDKSSVLESSLEDTSNTNDLALENSGNQSEDGSVSGDVTFTEAKPSVSPDVFPCAEVTLPVKENGTSWLEYVVNCKSDPPLNDYYRFTVCRLCFCYSDTLTNIFEKGQECNFQINNVIEDLLQFKVSKADDLPQFICSSCLKKLAEFKAFKDKLCELGETFKQVLYKMRKTVDEDNAGIDSVCSQFDYELDEVLEHSKDTNCMKPLSELEDHSSSEDTVSDFEDAAVEELPDSEIASNIDSGVDSIVLQREYKCHECGEVFQYLNILKKHNQVHQKKMPFPCQYCDKRFKSLMDLNNHIVMHSNYKPYECEHCGLRCRLKTTLARHKKVHTEDKPFLCSICGKNFRERTLLRRHLLMHSKIKCYKCEECGEEFSQSNSLEIHYSKHSEGKPHVCGDCGKSFRKKKSLNAHIVCVHQSEKLFQCDVCFKRFSIRKYLNDHLKIHGRQSSSIITV